MRWLFVIVTVLALLAIGVPVAARAGGVGAPLRIGVLTDLGSSHSGNTGYGSVLAAEMAVEDFGGRVNGRPIEVLAADHGSNPELGATIARRWYDQGVSLIVDVPNTGVALAVQKVAQEKNRIVIFSASAGSELTGAACTAVSLHWTYDTYALAHVTGAALLTAGFQRWYFITADYTFGHTLESEVAAMVRAAGGSVSGSVRFPINNSDFSSYLMQAMRSNAQVLALASAGTDTADAIRQAYEFGLLPSDRKFAALLLAIGDIHTLGLQVAQGLLLTTAFYWDADDGTRAFARRFFEKRHAMPNMYQAGVAGAVTHYLKAVAAAGTTETGAVMAKMRDLPVNDFMTRNGRVRPDGRVIRDMYLYQVKVPSDSKGPWDYLKLIRTIPGEQAFRPLEGSDCPLVGK